MQVPQILLIWQDNLWEGFRDVKVDWIPSGRSITPLASEFHPPRILHVFKCFFKLLTRQYEFVILPVINFKWHADRSPFKRQLRVILRVLFLNPLLAALIRSILIGKKTVVVFDRQDEVQLCDDYLKSVRASLCFKVNMARGMHAREYRILPMPVWLFVERYPPVRVTAVSREIDLFFCADMVSEARQKAVEELELLKKDGFNVLVITERISFTEYWEYLTRAKLVVSPEGYGFECFRHYEAMLAGAVPLINCPDIPRHSYLKNGRNAFFYRDNSNGLRDVARRILVQVEWLKSMSNQVKEYVRVYHSHSFVGKHVLAKLLVEGTYRINGSN